MTLSYRFFAHFFAKKVHFLMKDFEIKRGTLMRYNGTDSAVSVPHGVREIGSWAFQGNTRLVSVTLPDSVTEIHASAFEDCTALSDVTLPDSVTAIGEYAFAGCPHLRIRAHAAVAARLPEGYRPWAALGFLSAHSDPFYTEADCAYYRRWFAASLSLLVPHIAEDSTLLGALLLGDLLTPPHYDNLVQAVSAAGDAAQVAPLLAWGHSHARELDALREGALDRMLTAPPDSAALLSADWDWVNDDGAVTLTAYKGDASHVIVPASVDGAPVVALAPELFSPARDGLLPHRCAYFSHALLAVTLPDTLVGVSYGAFYDCKALRTVTLGARTRNLVGYAFYGCTALTELVLPPSVCYLGEYLCAGCTSLSAISLPAALSSVRERAFEHCTALTTVTFAGADALLGNAIFAGCPALKIYGKAGGRIERYARERDLQFVAE